MLGLAKRVRARILFSSTSEVYGDPEEHPQKESYWGHVSQPLPPPSSLPLLPSLPSPPTFPPSFSVDVLGARARRRLALAQAWPWPLTTQCR